MTSPILFDPDSGRVGRIQLELRWVLVSGVDVWPRRHALFTYESEELASDHIKLLKEYRPDQVPKLAVQACWCYPSNLYPAHLIPTL